MESKIWEKTNSIRKCSVQKYRRRPHYMRMCEGRSNKKNRKDHTQRGKTWNVLLFVLVLINYLAKVLKINRSKIVPVNLLWQLLIWYPRKKLYICVPIDRIYRLEEHLVINIVIWDVLKVAILYDFRLHVIWIKMWSTSIYVKNVFWKIICHGNVGSNFKHQMRFNGVAEMVSQKLFFFCIWSLSKHVVGAVYHLILQQ